MLVTLVIPVTESAVSMSTNVPTAVIIVAITVSVPTMTAPLIVHVTPDTLVTVSLVLM